MAAGKNFGRVNVSITASTGGLTAGLGRASKQLQGFRAGAQGMAGTITTALAGFVGLGRGATIAAVGIKALSMAIKTLLGPLLIVTSLVSIFAAFGRTASNLDEASKAAKRLGLSMTTFQNFSLMAEEAGVSVGQMTTLLTFMTRNLGQLSAGSKSAEKAFAGIGLTLQDLQNLAPEQQFELISQRIMALPTAAQRTAAAMAIFGRQGAMAMGLIESAANGTGTELKRLQAQLGITFSDEQLNRGLPQGIEMMNDAVARMSLVFQGFLNQFIAELAPAITTVANLFVQFFAKNTSGFSMAKTMAMAFGGAIKFLAGTVTFLYGAFQVLSSFVGIFIQGAIKAFEGITWAIQNTISTMRAAAEALPGFDVGLASSLRAAENTMAGLSTATGQEAAIWGQAAAANFANGVQNMADPLAAFDAEFASVTAQMQQAGAAAGTAAGAAAGEGISQAVRASGQALSAAIVGTSGGEAFRNSIMRGADPRLDGAKDQARTADATEQSAESLEEIEASLAGLGGGLGLATIMA
jgi:hypothetical protein